MQLEQLIRERRSIRKYNNLPVSQDLIIKLLQQAERLCSYDGEARWRYVYVGTPEARERLADYMVEKLQDNKIVKLVLSKVTDALHKRVLEVPASLIVIAKTDSNPIIHDQTYGAVCRIMQNLQLLGWEERIGMVWITDPMIQNERFYKRIGLQEGERFVGIVQMGYFDKAPKGRSRTPAERNWTEFVWNER
ncbi:nitroreductase [Paenibacillus cellulosilyticus]|uniref:Nitroreductase n=1 Tax=Paenibacillus cellulosilyticus TaxID=375489 RepID=A0A2V2YQW6_9BACL|nr:nitroreductase family protein [Paenibacillus cellulosilyticus]PWV99467.1 nitroreductase [Paenibacillus cellulosilyticus]QKS44723.1 nitroreductase family protein [Paenibacillus cellulosilyticus]